MGKINQQIIFSLLRFLYCFSYFLKFVSVLRLSHLQYFSNPQVKIPEHPLG